MHITGDVIQEVKKFDEFSYDIIFSDPPYNLGSQWQIGENGKPDTKGKAVDFMNDKWEGLTGQDLESMFNDFFRVLKHGGFCVFAGQMRQSMAFQYYAINSGFDMIEPIFSYGISAFPKSLNIEKHLMKTLGDEGKSLGIKKGMGKQNPQFSGTEGGRSEEFLKPEYEKFESTHPIAKRYKGVHSSRCPLKQTTEVWSIYRKPFKTGTVTKDIIAYEDGDSDITPSGLNIDAGRVPTSENLETYFYSGRDAMGNRKGDPIDGKNKFGKHVPDGRYPAQLFLDGAISYKREEIDLDNKDFLEFIGIDSDVINFMETEKAKDYVCQHLDKFDVSTLLDEQSGDMKSSYRPHFDNGSQYKYKEGSKNVNIGGGQVNVQYDDNGGGSSRILHNASFVLQELYQHIYYSKPSRYERNALISDKEIEEKSFSHNGRDKHIENPYQRHESKAVNNHPTLKSLKLLYNIITLFTKVDTEKMKVLIPFSGVFSEKIAFLAHRYKDENITTIEISPEYSEIGKARERFWIKNDFFFKDSKEVQNKIKQDLEKTGNTKTKNLF